MTDSVQSCQKIVKTLGIPRLFTSRPGGVLRLLASPSVICYSVSTRHILDSNYAVPPPIAAAAAGCKATFGGNDCCGPSLQRRSLRPCEIAGPFCDRRAALAL